MEISVRISANCCRADDIGDVGGVVLGGCDVSVNDRAVAIEDSFVGSRAIVEGDGGEEVRSCDIDGCSDQNVIRVENCVCEIVEIFAD